MTATEPPKIAVISDDSEDEMPALEEAATAAKAAAAPEVTNKHEKKARKAMEKLGAKPVADVERVAIKKQGGVLFVIATPTVVKSASSHTYVVFGESKLEDPRQQQQQMQAAAAANVLPSDPAAVQEEDDDDLPDLVGGASEAADGAADAADDDESGLDADEIDTVVSQSGASRAKAVAALRKEGNLVDAILSLTQG